MKFDSLLLNLSKYPWKMHGRKRRTEPLTDAEISASEVKAKTYNSLMVAIKERRQQNDFSLKTLALLGMN